MRFWLAAAVGLVFASTGPLHAQSLTNAPANRVPRQLQPPELPPLPVVKSPVDLFRELLAMTPVERRRALTNRPPEVQKRILAKVREYETLKPAEQDLRLRVTELQWYLLPLMSMPATNRAPLLSAVPEDLRTLVEERLKRWDLLSTPLQEQLLNDDMTSRYFTQLQSAGPTNLDVVLRGMSPARRAKLEAGLDRWRGLSEDERKKTLEAFNEFFELTPQKQEKALNTLSNNERQLMEKTLLAYGNLDAGQRAQCIRSFEKFTGMSLAERQQFLKNAERWKLMTAAERRTWRELVSKAPLLPPMPTRLPPMPPMPPTPQRGMASPAPTNSP
jgi:hypothetical protein